MKQFLPDLSLLNIKESLCVNPLFYKECFKSSSDFQVKYSHSFFFQQGYNKMNGEAIIFSLN